MPSSTSSTRYAEKTQVPSDRSRADIERTLERYGATAYAYGWEAAAATIVFEMAGRRIRFRLPMPDRTNRAFTHTPSRGTPRGADAAKKEYEQAVRQRWAALALVIKAKLEAVAADITSVEEEFLAHIVMPDDTTVAENVVPRIAEAYATGNMPALLAGPGGGR